MAMTGNTNGITTEINVTPLVDVVLVLLIIFMVVVPFAMLGHDVDTPTASAEAATPMVEETQVILKITAAGCRLVGPPGDNGLPAGCRVQLDDQEVTAANLPTSVAKVLGDRPVGKRVLFLAAEDGLNYEGVLRIVDLAKANLDDVTIEVITAD